MRIQHPSDSFERRQKLRLLSILKPFEFARKALLKRVSARSSAVQRGLAITGQHDIHLPSVGFRLRAMHPAIPGQLVHKPRERRLTDAHLRRERLGCGPAALHMHDPYLPQLCGCDPGSAGQIAFI